MKRFSILYIFPLLLSPTLVLSYPPFVIPNSELPSTPPEILAPKFENPTITNCFLNNSIEHILPSSPAYLGLARPYNLRFNYKPAAIAYPKTQKEVQRLVKCAIKLDFRYAIRGGGHSYGAFGLGGEDGRLVIDMERFHEIKYEGATEIVKVGAGVRVGNLASQLLEHGRA